jgi:molybdopterin synthase sulfur carrier subunit
VAVVRLFASARTAAGRSRDELPGTTVGDVLDAARLRYGGGFAEVLESCRIWLNGEPAALSMTVAPDDEIAVLPPVSGGVA